jgi:hypothetical protein
MHHLACAPGPLRRLLARAILSLLDDDFGEEFGNAFGDAFGEVFGEFFGEHLGQALGDSIKEIIDSGNLHLHSFE